ncbi:hypothetical protein V8C42DRAFT_322141, partial [Trichoderma barbatum]
MKIMALAMNLAVFAYTRETEDVEALWVAVATTPHQLFVKVWLLSPLADVAETILYLTLKRWNAREYTRRQLLVVGRPWLIVLTERLWLMVVLLAFYYLIMGFGWAM